MVNVLTIVYLLVALAIVGLVLLQQGKGADAGASFGAGAAGTVFGSAGSGNFLSRMTAVFAIVFFALSLIIGNLNSNHSAPSSQFDDLSDVQQKVEQLPKTENSDIPQ